MYVHNTSYLSRIKTKLKSPHTTYIKIQAIANITLLYVSRQTINNTQTPLVTRKLSLPYARIQ